MSHVCTSILENTVYLAEDAGYFVLTGQLNWAIWSKDMLVLSQLMHCVVFLICASVFLFLRGFWGMSLQWVVSNGTTEEYLGIIQQQNIHIFLTHCLFTCKKGVWSLSFIPWNKLYLECYHHMSRYMAGINPRCVGSVFCRDNHGDKNHYRHSRKLRCFSERYSSWLSTDVWNIML